MGFRGSRVQIPPSRFALRRLKGVGDKYLEERGPHDKGVPFFLRCANQCAASRIVISGDITTTAWSVVERRLDPHEDDNIETELRSR
jgi:hypothetical protein